MGQNARQQPHLNDAVLGAILGLTLLEEGWPVGQLRFSRFNGLAWENSHLHQLRIKDALG